MSIYAELPPDMPWSGTSADDVEFTDHWSCDRYGRELWTRPGAWPKINRFWASFDEHLMPKFSYEEH